MSDNRIAAYRAAAEALRRGRFDVEIPAGGEDEVARLGAALRGLASALKAQADRSSTLTNITERINEGLVLEDVLDLVYDSFFSLIPYDRIGLALIEDNLKTVRAHWARSEAAVIKLGGGYAAELAGTSLEEVMRSRRPRILNDLEAYLEAHPESESTALVVAEGMRSSLTCPLLVKGEPLGFLFFSSLAADTYREVHQDIFTQIAGQLAVILEKSRLYRELVRLNSSLQETTDALEQLATRDALTGLWNRRSILELLQRELARGARDNRPLAVVMLDVDHFKSINDRIGHVAGDRVLREITHRVGLTLRSADVLGRLGGEEFLVILSPADRKTAVDVMERARQACAERPIETDDGEFRVTVSLGAAVVEPGRSHDSTTVLKAADRALYRAKNGGRNRSEVEDLG